MMREPWFWRSHSITARFLTAAFYPAALLYQGAHRLRWAVTKPARAPLPVICIGNATLGGAGKTPFAIMVATLLRAQGVKSCFLTRGYGGAAKGPIFVKSDRHDADDVGDEALLLAREAPVVVSANRAAGAVLAAKSGADVIIMDDGFQNPTLHKDQSILLVSAQEAASNGALFPAGPFREPASRARARADLAVSVSDAGLSADFHATLIPAAAPMPGRVIAFAGIGQPEKFFVMLENLGYDLVQRIAFPDHHRFSAAELKFLQRDARRRDASLICTEKDLVRLPEDFRDSVQTLPVRMEIDDPARLSDRLMSVIKPGMRDKDKATP